MKWTNSVKPALGASAVFIAVLASTSVHAADYNAVLSANPANYNGKCPTVIAFNGTISARKAGRVQYKFIRSDNAFAPVQTLEFAGPGTKPVNTTWTLGGPAFRCRTAGKPFRSSTPPAFNPTRHTSWSNVPHLRSPKPEITGYRMPGPQGACVPKGGRFTILGRHFGTQAGKGVALGGHGIHVDLPVSSWSDSQIVATLPDDPRIQERQWYYTGVEKDSHNQWLSNISKNITVCPSRKPDLVIRQFGLKKWGTCAPNNAVITFQVTVANIGTAPSPAITDFALVQVMDGHRNWGNGAKLGAIRRVAARRLRFQCIIFKTILRT